MTKEAFIDQLQEAIQAYNRRVVSLHVGSDRHAITIVGEKLQEAVWWALLTPGGSDPETKDTP